MAEITLMSVITYSNTGIGLHTSCSCTQNTRTRTVAMASQRAIIRLSEELEWSLNTNVGRDLR
jgi:hypothetical protein